MLTTGRLILLEVGDPARRIEADSPLGPTLPPSAHVAAAEAPLPRTAGVSGGDHEAEEAAKKFSAGLSGDEEHGVGEHEAEWLKKTSADEKGPKKCWLRAVSIKELEGAVLHIVQV